MKTNRSLEITEKWYSGGHSDAALHSRPIFIVGAPRCGSTLLYQSMSAVFDLAFISNIHCFLHGAPWLVELLLNPSENYQASDYRSKYGSVKGAYAPSECGNYWYRFFQRNPQYAPLDECEPKRLEALRTSIRALIKAGQKPLLIKNLVCILRLEALLHTLPESLFIVLHREDVDMAHSILESRKKRMGSYEAWFSVEPPHIEKLRTAPVVHQVVEQIRSAYKLIEEAEQKDSGRFYHLHYEQFCDNPAKELKNIQSFFVRHQMEIPITGPLPGPFERRTEIRIDRNLYNELLQYFEKQNE